MSDHKSNPQALYRATMPALLPPGYGVAVEFQVQVAPQENVKILPAHQIRVQDGKTEILLVTKHKLVVDKASVGGVPVEVPAGEETPVEEWGEPPAGVYVHELGKPLATERCDALVNICTIVRDKADKGIVGLDGKPRAPQASGVGHGPIMRMPLLLWQGLHLANLRPVG
jgi:hypothetical protein